MRPRPSHDAEIEPALQVVRATEHQVAKTCDLVFAQRVLDDEQEVDVTPAGNVAAEDERPVQDGADQQVSELGGAVCGEGFCPGQYALL
jgi:hypothetical protein